MSVEILKQEEYTKDLAVRWCSEKSHLFFVSIKSFCKHHAKAYLCLQANWKQFSADITPYLLKADRLTEMIVAIFTINPLNLLKNIY